MKRTRDIESKVAEIRSRDIVPHLENALNYGSPWDTLYVACLEEITELRRQVLDLGGSLEMKTGLDGVKQYQRLEFTDTCESHTTD